MATQTLRFRSVNPFTEEEIESFEISDEATVGRALDAASAAFHTWGTTSVAERSDRLRALAAVLRRDADAHAAAITQEMGKTLREAKAEVEKCAFVCEYVADNAARFLGDEAAPSDSPRSLVTYEPLGIVFACMPWNFPYWQVFRCAALAIGAGNCVVLKHANNVTRCGFNIESAFREAGFPESVFTMLVLPVDRVAAVIADPRIAAVSLTGSTAAGRSVGAAAGEHLKRCVLELGGSDAFIVLEDADLEEAASVAARARFQNAGQSCIAAKRFIVVDAVADAFVERFVARTNEITIGDPTDHETQMGPLARRDLVEGIERQLRDTLNGGGRLRCGGHRPARPGFFFEPTVVDRCDVNSVAFQEETFGPLAAVMTVRDEQHAVQVANASRFGLGGNVWTRDVERGRRVARAMETGGVFINGMTHSDPRIPFGGVKESGYGRELHRIGMHEFVNVKTVWVPPLADAETAQGAR